MSRRINRRPIELGNILYRHWTEHFSPSEFYVLSWIFQRSTAWGWTEERIPTRHFLDGVKDGKTGRCIQAPISISKSTLWKVIGKLTDRGVLISTSSTRHPYSARFYEINFEWKPQKVGRLKCHQNLQPARVRIRKRKGKSETSGILPVSGNRTVIRKETELRERDRIRTAGELAGSSLGDQSEGKVVKRIEVKRPADSVEQLWSATFAEIYPKAPRVTWTAAEVAAVKQALDRTENVSPAAFIKFVVVNWRSVLRSLSGPRFPSPLFFVKCVHTFSHAYAVTQGNRPMVVARGELAVIEQQRDTLQAEVQNLKARVALAEVHKQDALAEARRARRNRLRTLPDDPPEWEDGSTFDGAGRFIGSNGSRGRRL